MATVFGIITFIVLLTSAFIASKNNQRLAHEIELRNTALKNQKNSEKELTRQQEISEQLEKDLPQVLAETEETKKQDEEFKKTNPNSDIESKNSKLTSLQREYEDMKTTISAAGEPSELSAKAKKMRIDLQELDVVISNKESREKNLKAEVVSASQLAARLKENVDAMSKGTSLPTLKTKIQQIYPNWGFVTLAGGYKSGVTGGSSLQVVRDGAVIAKLVVTAVETTSSSASIVPDSIAQDITLRVGDTVVPIP